MTASGRTTIDEAELARFDQLGEEWWNPRGPMRTLHKFNPVRAAWIRDLAIRMFGPGDDLAAPLAGRRILDVGCGGGILSESLARLGAEMVGIDPAPSNVEVAARHAAADGLAIDYRRTSVESLASTGETFDVVLVMEVVEHVRDVPRFMRDATAMVRPGGLLFCATLNRTAKSYALAIVGAEYVLGWIPRGTHDWHRFVTPAEFARHLRRQGLEMIDEAGVVYAPLRDRWHLSRDMGCNYMLAAQRSEASGPRRPVQRVERLDRRGDGAGQER